MGKGVRGGKEGGREGGWIGNNGSVTILWAFESGNEERRDDTDKG
jgi:hypothetical protein